MKDAVKARWVERLKCETRNQKNNAFLISKLTQTEKFAHQGGVRMEVWSGRWKLVIAFSFLTMSMFPNVCTAGRSAWPLPMPISPLGGTPSPSGEGSGCGEDNR